MSQVLDNLVHMIQEEESVSESMLTNLATHLFMKLSNELNGEGVYLESKHTDPLMLDLCSIIQQQYDLV